MKTFSAKAQEIERKWYVIDAKDQILGDVAVTAANVLRGKNKPVFTPHVDTGDFVVIVNAKEVVVTGRKEEQKTYVSVSGYIGSKKVRTVRQVREKHAERLLQHAIKGMIPKTRLGNAVFRKLKVYSGAEHPHEAQQPTPLAIA